MLAADAGIAMASPAIADSAHTHVVETASIGSEASRGQHALGSHHLVIVDSDFADESALLSTIDSGADFVVLDAQRDPLTQVTEILAQRRELASIHLLSHASEGVLKLAGQRVDAETLSEQSDVIRSWRRSFTDGADLLLYGCDLAASEDGRFFVQELGRLTGLDVAASTNKTGSSLHLDHSPAVQTSDWELEYSRGVIEPNTVLNHRALEQLDVMLSIEIYAAGDIGDEIMNLQIGEDVVGTWSMAGTDALSGSFGRFDVGIDNVSVDDIRINFENDLWDPSTGFDRNLRVDRIVVDGVTYQTENPAVFSNASWSASDGIVPGFRQSEYLNASGFFQYSSSGGDAPGGSRIEIEALGETGQESMELLIDGTVVQRFDNLSSNFNTYVYQANETVTADRIQIRFANDLFDASTGLDRNLTVDRIRIDGQAFETEAPTTYSTGFFDSSRGTQLAGFFQNETLFVGGRFEYLSSTNPSNPPGNGEEGSFVLTTDFVRAFENEASVFLQIDRVGGSEGNATVQYSTASESATAGSDFVETAGTLFFASGET
ncbi:MAG: DUF4347 domain-containing protein, partial [Planctomycetota bacterium]